MIGAALLSLGVLPGVLLQDPQARGPRAGMPPWFAESWRIRREVEAPWVLAGGNVVDVRNGEILEAVDVVVAADRIQAIGKGVAPEGAERLDVSGSFVIPGLFDLHAHVIPKSMFFPEAEGPEDALRSLLMAGVTTIRLLPFYSESSLGWAARVDAGELEGPTVVSASSIMEKTPQRTSIGFGDPETAALWVRKEALLGVRWIKVYNHMDPESLGAIVETAAEYGMRVCGHTEEVPPLEAARLGMGSVEHIIGIPLSCLVNGASEPPGLNLLERTAWRWEHLAPERASELMEAFRTHGTAWIPTLVVSERMHQSGAHDGVAMDPDKLRGLNDALTRALRRAAELAVEQHRKGGLVGVGTDFPVDGVPVGSSVHREMELLVELGGATPLEALQMATTSSARILGFEELLGTLEPGKVANLVVLEKNPLEAIGNTRGIQWVVHDGRRRRVQR